MSEILTEETATGIPGIAGIVPNDPEHTAFRKISKPAERVPSEDRPGWIPPEITHDWDPNPYAYQTEEELMPAGSLHGKLVAWLEQVLQTFLETKGIDSLVDTFILYRDKKGVRQRVAPDILVVPPRSLSVSAYDLDAEPTPLAAIEVTSPKSRASDMKKKVTYSALGIPAYLVIDPFAPDRKPDAPFQLILWRKGKSGFRKKRKDADGYLRIPEFHVKIKAEGERLVLADIVTGKTLRDNRQLEEAEARAKQRAEQADKKAERADKRLKQERQRAEQERQRAEQERQRAEQERQRAEQERQRAEKEEQIAQQERQKAQQADKKAERLAAKLREMGISPDDIV